jgi:hypothetical protein
MSYSRREQMLNLDREDRRETRRLSNPQLSIHNQPNSEPNGLHLFEKIHTLAPFLKQLLIELGTKYAKIQCSISNIETKTNLLNEHKQNITLPDYMHHQQKFVNTIESMDTKNEMILHILTMELNKLDTVKANLLAKSNDKYLELQSHLKDGTTFKTNLNELKKYFDASIENSFHTMQLKMFKDIQRKEEKHKKFLEKKERDNAEITVKAKDIKNLLKQIEQLKLQQKQLAKNVNGKTGNKKKRTALPKKKMEVKLKGPKVTRKPRKSLKSNGKKKGTTSKTQH